MLKISSVTTKTPLFLQFWSSFIFKHTVIILLINKLISIFYQLFFILDFWTIFVHTFGIAKKLFLLKLDFLFLYSLKPTHSLAAPHHSQPPETKNQRNRYKLWSLSWSIYFCKWGNSGSQNKLQKRQFDYNRHFVMLSNKNNDQTVTSESAY